MKKCLFALVIIAVSLTAFLSFKLVASDESAPIKQEEPKPVQKEVVSAPAFYKGIYLTNPSGKQIDRLKKLIVSMKKSQLNTVVIDVQPAKNWKSSIPAENVKYILDNGIYPIARVVCFQDGLRAYPVPETLLAEKIAIAKSAAESGFKEIQFDYIRFNDGRVNGPITLTGRFDFIEGFLARAKKELQPYNVRVAADVFGRIPLNSGDAIGQRMEGLDKVTDVICPMAYPSHYTWSNKMMADPYYTVFLTSSRARERTKQAEIVSYIQAFKMKVGRSGLSYNEYVLQQVKAVHDSKIRGYIFWNAAQDYEIPFIVTANYYSRLSASSSENKSSDQVKL